MYKWMITLVIIVVMSSTAHGYVYSDYTWYTYNGHQYALTLDVGNWDQMEAEATAIGAHLVTINNQAEHNWLGCTFRPPDEPVPYLWIGFYQDHDDPDYSEPAGGWKWVSGEPVTFLGWGGQEPTNHPPGEDYAVFRRGEPPCVSDWNDWGPERPDFYPIQGIIEISEPPEPPIPVEIDIKPGSWPNAINLGSNGVIPVAILTTETFDATSVDPSTVQLEGLGVAVRGKSEKLLANEEDVDEDGDIDLVVKIETENLEPGAWQSGPVVLTGETYDGQAIEGWDEIIIVPPEE